jgi:hypothetical protein
MRARNKPCSKPSCDRRSTKGSSTGEARSIRPRETS